MSEAEEVVQNKSHGLFAFSCSIVKAIIWGVAIGFVINCYLWHTNGYTSLMSDLNSSYSNQMSDISFRNKEVATEFKESSGALSHGIDWMINKTSNIQTSIPYTNNTAKGSFVRGKVSKIEVYFSDVYNILITTFKVHIAKFIGLLASFWLFVFASILGACDGLLMRYIRTSEGGRESTFVFHRVTGNVIKVPVSIVFIYLTIPVSPDPEIVAVIISILFYMFFYIATSNLKKFL